MRDKDTPYVRIEKHDDIFSIAMNGFESVYPYRGEKQKRAILAQVRRFLDNPESME